MPAPHGVFSSRWRPFLETYATLEPKDFVLFICGGLGGLHALGLHSFGSSLAQTKPVAAATPAAEMQAAE